MNRVSNSDFDSRLSEKLAEIHPVDDDLQGINPWQAPISAITWGLLFSTIQLNVIYLQYILPTIGFLMIYLGFRSLRMVNPWFRMAWIASIIGMVGQFIYLAIVPLPIFANDALYLPLFITFGIIRLALLVLFRKALQTVFQNAGMRPKRDPLLWAIIWTFVIGLCSIPPLSTNPLILLPLVIFYFFILRSLFMVQRDLEPVGYDMFNAPIKTSKHLVGIVYMLLCLVVVIGSSFYSNHLHLDASVYTTAKNADTIMTLSELGAPEKCLEILSDSNLAMLDKTIKIETASDRLQYQTSLGSDLTNIRATTVFFRQPNKDLYILVYFEFLKGHAIWNDGFYVYSPDAFQLIDGGLVYQQNGKRYRTQIPRLTSGTMTQNDFFGESSNYGITGGVSFPFNTDCQQGYVLYFQSAEVSEFAWSGFNYVHFLSPVRLPYKTPEQMLLDGVGNIAFHYAEIWPTLK